MELTVGAIIEGKVTGITKFGAFVSLGEGKSGLVHISEISDSFVTDVSQFVSVGDTVRVRILAIDADGKIRLSIKKAVDAPAPSPRPAPRPAAPSPAPSSPTGGTTLDDMLKRFMSESNANQAPSSSRRSGYEKRSAKKPNRRNYDD
ncbi:MAG: S1 RNA-binding domain-containing protein [Clostridia bacterium]|nr:S1 RNA-binding domain-containing protein [Clostridia bacterium]